MALTAFFTGYTYPDICRSFTFRENPQVTFRSNFVPQIKNGGMWVDIDICQNILDRTHDLPDRYGSINTAPPGEFGFNAISSNDHVSRNVHNSPAALNLCPFYTPVFQDGC